MKPCLYILCGLPFAGKSTLAHALVEQFGFVHIDMDQINKERGFGITGNTSISAEDWAVTYEESYKRTEEALASGKTVIHDSVNFTRVQRDTLRTIARAHNIPATVIYVDTPREIAKKRWQHNRMIKGRNDVRDEDFAEVADNFQAPTEDERVLYFDQSMPSRDWIDTHFSQVKR